MNHIKKIFFKLLLSFIVISMIPLFIASWVSYNHSNTALNRDLNNYASIVLEQKANALKLFLYDLQRMEYIISRNRVVSQFLNNKDDGLKYYQSFIHLDPLIEGVQTIRPESVGISIINESGLIYFYGYSLNSESQAGSYLNYNWTTFLSRADGKPYFTSVHERSYVNHAVSGHPDEPVFSYINSFWDLTFRNQGVLVIDVPVAALEPLFTNQVNNDISGTFIIDQRSRLIYPQNPTAITDIYKDFHPRQVQHIQVPNGEDYRMFYYTDPLTGWTIVSYFSQKELYADIHSYRKIILWIVVISAILSLIASLYISYNISNPIKKLVRSMKKIEKGELNHRITLKQRDEIGQLGVGFNRMLGHIQSLIDKVYEQQQMKRAAEISALQAQINPHFLYNTLESINSHARHNKQREISKQIALLGKLLRFSISTFNEFVSFEQEIRYVEHYLQINKIRMKEDAFDFSIDFSENILHLYTIKWILQPLVENAIIHGLEPKGRMGVIRIVGKEHDDDLLITVQDNGAGIPQGKLEHIRIQLEYDAERLTKYQNKVGLFNVQSRIRLHYGSSYGISIDSLPEQGTTIYMRLPRRTNIDESTL